MKKITVINSTMRKGGNSEILAKEFIKGAKEQGHLVTEIDLRDVSMTFCKGCMACQTLKKCVINDGVNDLLQGVSSSDILVFATPVYYYGMSGQLKTLLDRMNALFAMNNRFKEVYLLSSCADEEETAIYGTKVGIEGWISCFDGVTLKDHVLATGATNVGDALNSPAAKQAYELGKKIK